MMSNGNARAPIIDDSPSPPPLPTLAPELWLEVFKYAPTSVIGISHYTPPLSISQVCRAWRALALDEPHLWTSLSWEPTRDDMAARTAPVWILHLQRSRQAPLDLAICPRANVTQISVGVIGELLETTLLQQHRFRSLQILVGAEHLSPERVYLLSSAPLLTYVDICVNEAIDGVQDPNAGGSIMVDLSGCPAVKSLNIEGRTLMHRDTGYLESLENAHLIHDPSNQGQDLTCSHLLSFFRSTPSLEKLTAFVGIGNIFPPVRPKVSLPRLRKLNLVLASGDTESPDGLFGSLDLPSLEQLDLSIDVFDTFEQEWHHASSLQKLQSLKLRYARNQGPAGNDEISTLLSFTPTLKSLHLSACWLSSMTMEQLTLRNWPFDLCPGLELITLDSDMFQRNVTTHHVGATALIAMITTRWRPDNGEGVNEESGALKRIRLRLPGLQDIRNMEPVRSYIQEGLVVEMF